MKYQGNKEEKILNFNSNESFKRCLSALNLLHYNIISQSLEFGEIKFVSTENQFYANGNYIFNCSIVKISDTSSKCIIWSEEALDQPIPLFEMLLHSSNKIAKKVLSKL